MGAELFALMCNRAIGLSPTGYDGRMLARGGDLESWRKRCTRCKSHSTSVRRHTWNQPCSMYAHILIGTPPLANRMLSF